MPFPLPSNSPAQWDLRFSYLRKSTSTNFSTDDYEGKGGRTSAAVIKKAWQDDALPIDDNAEQTHLLDILVTLINQKLTGSMGMGEGMDSTRPLTSYGIDSLVALELRNWRRAELGIASSTLDVVSAKALQFLAERLLGRGLYIYRKAPTE